MTGLPRMIEALVRFADRDDADALRPGPSWMSAPGRGNRPFGIDTLGRNNYFINQLLKNLPISRPPSFGAH
jgi:hypothetical protein